MIGITPHNDSLANAHRAGARRTRARALVLFQQALEREPESARVFAQLGVTYQALGRWVLADTYLSQALARGGDPYIERHRPALEQASALVKDHLGLLDVQGSPAGAEVQLNGQSFGKLPLAEPVRVPVGSYLMEVSLAGHYGISEPIRISARALTRESLCGDERSAGQRAQTVALVSGGVALAFAAGAPWTGLSVSSSSSEQAGLESCSVGFASALCSGRF
jgi:hypothetical protein